MAVGKRTCVLGYAKQIGCQPVFVGGDSNFRRLFTKTLPYANVSQISSLCDFATLRDIDATSARCSICSMVISYYSEDTAVCRLSLKVYTGCYVFVACSF